MSRPALPEQATLLVTGAHSVLGQALAERLAAHAARLVLVGGGDTRLLEAEARHLAARHPGLDCRAIACDLGHAGDLANLMRRVRVELPGIDLWAHVAGTSPPPRALGQGTFEPYELHLQSEVRALTRLSHAWVGGMQAQGQGGFLWLGRAEGHWPLFGGPLEVAARRFMSGLADGMRSTLLGSGVQVTEVCHGPTTRDAMVAMAVPGAEQASMRWAISPEEIAAEAVEAFLRGRTRVVPGFAFRQALRLARMLPPRLRWTLEGLGRRRRPQERLGRLPTVLTPPLLH